MMTGRSPKARRPGIFRVGQKHRLNRHSSISRSSSTPYLQSMAAAASEPKASAMTRGIIGAGLGLVKNATSPGASRSTVDLTAPHRSDNPFAYMQTATSSSPTTASLSTAASQGKKKFGLFTLKSTKDIHRSESSYDLGLTSPLPPLTPSKAKQLLGLDVNDVRLGGERLDNPSHSNANSRQTKLAEVDVEANPPPKKSSFWSGSNKALRMLDMRSRQTKHMADEEPATTISWSDPMEYGEASSGGNISVLPQRTSMNPRGGQDKIRRRRKRGPKMLDKMSPITEMSHDALHTAYRNSAHNTELDVISEYEAAYPPRSASLLPPSQRQAMLQGHGPYQLAQGDISPSEKPRQIPYMANDYTVHPGREVDLNSLRWKPCDTSNWRSPLQQIEDRLLDETEEELIIQEVNIGRRKAAKLDLDEDVEALKVLHESMRHEFATINQPLRASQRSANFKKTQVHNGGDSLLSIDEETVVCVAQVKMFTNVTGQVKPVFITRRRRRVMPIGKRFENFEPVSPTHIRSQSYNRLTKVPRPKMPRNESQLLVQDWITNYDRAEQRPLSERVDPDVLADQEIPPAPFPKEEPISPHPPRTSSRHYCLHNGHLLRPINLKYVPDEVSINSLGVRPYFQTHTGVRQHVHVPVPCNKCGDDVNEEIWECEIPICRVAVCKDCALEMEQEWQQRAIGTWRY